jgi:hypothetical protein
VEAEGSLRIGGWYAFGAGQWRVRLGELELGHEHARYALQRARAMQDGRLEVRARSLLLRLELERAPAEALVDEADQLVALIELLEDWDCLGWLQLYRCLVLARAGQRQQAVQQARLASEHPAAAGVPLLDLVQLLGQPVEALPEVFTADAVAIRQLGSHVTVRQPLPPPCRRSCGAIPCSARSGT